MKIVRNTDEMRSGDRWVHNHWPVSKYNYHQARCSSPGHLAMWDGTGFVEALSDCQWRSRRGHCRRNSFRGRWAVAQTTMRTEGVITPPPRLNQHASLGEAVEDFAVEQCLAQAAPPGFLIRDHNWARAYGGSTSAISGPTPPPATIRYISSRCRPLAAQNCAVFCSIPSRVR